MKIEIIGCICRVFSCFRLRSGVHYILSLFYLKLYAFAPIMNCLSPSFPKDCFGHKCTERHARIQSLLRHWKVPRLLRSKQHFWADAVPKVMETLPYPHILMYFMSFVLMSAPFQQNCSVRFAQQGSHGRLVSNCLPSSHTESQPRQTTPGLQIRGSKF